MAAFLDLAGIRKRSRLQPSAGARIDSASRDPGSGDRVPFRVIDPKRPLGSSGLWILVSLMAAAAAFRIWSVLALSRDLRISEPILDGRIYLDLARTLSQGGAWPAGPFFMTPLYPALLSILFRIAPPSTLTVQVLQSALGLGTLGLLMAAVRRDFGNVSACLAAGLYVFCGPILAMESLVLTESLLLFLAAGALWSWPRPESHESRVKDLVFGVLCGLLAIGRGVFLLLPAGAILSLWLTRTAGRPARPENAPAGRPVRSEKASAGRPAHAEIAPTGPVRSENAPAGRPPRAGIASCAPNQVPPRGKPAGLAARTAFILAGTALALLPVAVHQTRATGHPALTTTNGGLNFFLGNNPAARGIYSQPPEIDLSSDFTAASSASRAAGRPLSLEESSRFWMGRSLAFIRNEPAQALWLFGRKALLYLSPREIPQIENFDALRGDAPVLRVAFIGFSWILPLAVLGIILTWKKRAAAPWLTLIAVGWVSTVLFFATGRYRVPFLAGFIGPAAVGLEQLIGMARSRRFRMIALAVPVIAGVEWLLPSYPVAKARAHDLFQLGQRLDDHGDHAAALTAYHRSLGLWPEGGEAWHGIGVALVQMGRPAEAVEAFRGALARMPDSAPTHYDLGAVYGQLGQDGRALDEFREAVRLEPSDPSYRSDLAVALARTGRKEDAISEFREVLRDHPGFERARQGLAALGAQP